MSTALNSATKIAYLGPQGTFSEEALCSQSDLLQCELIPVGTIADAIRSAASGVVDYAFVPIENSIEGSVSMTIDELIFGDELFIQREVIIDIHLDLLALDGVMLGEITEVVSHPHALAQVRRFVADHLPSVVTTVVNSTADGARIVAEQGRRDLAAFAPPITAKLYSLNVLAHAVEDQLGNETRFVLIAPTKVQAKTGHDRTAVVCFQRTDHPGGLHDLLNVFASRSINLARIESRPTKLALGDYCFVIELEGHISDPIVAEALSELYEVLAELRFLGSYPVLRNELTETRDELGLLRSSARVWLDSIFGRIEG
jgi:prephenate dehydratase